MGWGDDTVYELKRMDRLVEEAREQEEALRAWLEAQAQKATAEAEEAAEVLDTHEGKYQTGRREALEEVARWLDARDSSGK